MKFLISPGLPRSGTTYLFSQLSYINRNLFNAPHDKETNIFWKNRDFTELLPELFERHDSEKYYLDFSPSYMEGRLQPIERIAKLAESHDVKILLHLRNPVEQAFAHYLHDVAAHASRLEFGDSAHYPFWDAKVLKRYLVKRAPLIRRLVDGVGRENILVVNFHRDVPDAAGLSRRVGQFLGLDLKPFSSAKVGVGGWLPRYLYAGERSAVFIYGERVLALPARQVLLVNGELSRMWNDVKESFAMMLLRGQASWTAELDEEQCEALWSSFFKADFNETLSILDEQIDDYPRPVRLTSRLPGLGPATLSDLNPITSLPEFLKNAGVIPL